MELLKAIINRCSVRSYLPRPVEPEALQCVLDAADTAPSGRNLKSNRVFVLQGDAVLEELNRAVVAATKAGNAEGVSKAQAAAIDPETYCFFYRAPVVLLISGEKDNYNAMADTGCLLENAMVQAAALGMGTCWLNNVRRTQNDPAVAALLARYGLKENEFITGGMSLGYPAEPLRDAPRTGRNQVIYVR